MMQTKETRLSVVKPAIFPIVFVGLILLFIGCQTGDAGKDPASQGQPEQKSGSQLWAQNCMQCHNSRSPASYSDGEWDVAMHHMRIRAPLTGEEHRKILEFLKAGN